MYILYIYVFWLVVSTPLKNTSQWEGLSHILWKIKHVWNHQPDVFIILVYYSAVTTTCLSNIRPICPQQSEWSIITYLSSTRRSFHSHVGRATGCTNEKKGEHYLQIWWFVIEAILKLSFWGITIPICSMYGIFTYIYPTNGPNVGKYTIHGAYGI